MRLAELDPHWLTFEGRRVGVIFRSPTNRDWWQVVIVEPFKLYKGSGPLVDGGYGTIDSQDALVRRCCPAAIGKWQPAADNAPWSIANIDNAAFETLTISPSVDGSAGGLWHGFVTAGDIVGGI